MYLQRPKIKYFPLFFPLLFFSLKNVTSVKDLKQQLKQQLKLSAKVLALTQQKLQKYTSRPSKDKFQPSESLERKLLLDRTFAYARAAGLKAKEDFMAEMVRPAVQVQPISKRRWDGDDWSFDVQPSSPKKQIIQSYYV